MDALPALQVAYFRARSCFDDSILWFGDDRIIDFLAVTMGESDLWHFLVAVERLADTDVCECHWSGKY